MVILVQSFYLGMAIEFIGALCGGKPATGLVNIKAKDYFLKKDCLHLLSIKTFPYYKNYTKEIKLFLNEIKKLGLRIPGSFQEKQKYLYVLKEDYKKLKDLN